MRVRLACFPKLTKRTLLSSSPVEFLLLSRKVLRSETDKSAPAAAKTRSEKQGQRPASHDENPQSSAREKLSFLDLETYLKCS